jgi:hypothetical protein
MTQLRLAPISEAAIVEVLANLSADDAQELHAAGIADAHAEFVRAACLATYAGACYAEQQCIAVFGVTPHPNDPAVGICWMIGTEGVKQHPRQWMRLSHSVVRIMQRHAVVLLNLVYCGHARAIRWLECLGFTLHRDQPCGPGGAFIPFVMQGAADV